MQGAMRSRGFIEDTEMVRLPRYSTIPRHFELVQIYRRILFVGDILVENVIDIEWSEHVLL